LNRFFHGQDEDFAVADRALAAGSAKLQQALHRAIDKVVVHGDLEFHLAEQIGGVFVAAVSFGLAALPRKAHGVANGKAGHANPFECLLHQVELGGLDNSDNKLHGNTIAGQNAVAYSILGPAIWAKCSAMNRLGQSSDGNVQAILAHWFSLPELSGLKVEEIPGGLSDSRLWRVEVGERAFCLRRTPVLLFLPEQVYDLRHVHAFLKYLQRQGYHDIAYPIVTLTQDTLVKASDALWELTNFLPGQAIKTPSDEQSIAAIEYLAKLHVGAEHYQRLEPRYARALKDRRKICQELASGKLDELSAAIEACPPEIVSELSRQIVLQVRSALAQVMEHLERGYVRLPLQWCLVDCHFGNFLFTEDRVTGLVDFGTAHPGSIARDIARLVGSVTAHNLHRWQACLDTYQKQRPLTVEELHAVLAFHSSGLLGRAARWLEWRFIKRAEFADAATTHARLGELSAQLAAIDETAAIIAAFSRGLP
jgi:Ser/Thr protein kinase RdoA (MazF antagonist)